MFDAPLNERPARVEWLLIGGLLGLIIMGTASVYSATMGSVSMTGKQVIWYLAGITAGGIFCFIPYHNLTRWALVAYWVTILLLIAVLVPGIGSSKSGARRWIEAGSFQFQPSEFAKLAFIFVQAQFLSRPLEELRSPGIFAKALGLPPDKADTFADSMKAGMAKLQPIPRAGLPEDIARAAVFLASDDSTFINSHDLVVDGGVVGGRLWGPHQEGVQAMRQAFGLEGARNQGGN